MAVTLADADRAIAAAEQAGVVLQVGFNRRFAPAFAAARAAIDAGRIGTPQLLRSLTRDPGPFTADPTRIPQWTIFFETLIHEAKDYTRHLLDVTCETEDIASPRGRGLVAQKMAQVIAKIPNAVQREGFLLDVARRLEVPRSVLDEEVRKAEAAARRAPNDPQRHNLGTPEHEMSGEGTGENAAPQEPLHPDKLIEARSTEPLRWNRLILELSAA